MTRHPLIRLTLLSSLCMALFMPNDLNAKSKTCEKMHPQLFSKFKHLSQETTAAYLKLRNKSAARKILHEAKELKKTGEELLNQIHKKGTTKIRYLTSKCAKEKKSLEELFVKLKNTNDLLISKQSATKKSLTTQDPNRDIFILALDGGGVRGIIGARFIQAIEEKTGKPITELFDYFAGTSTGGLLALLMNLDDGNKAQRYSGKQAVKMYKVLADKVFEKNILRDIKTLKGLIRSKFSAKPLMKLLQAPEYFGTTPLKQALKRTWVIAWDTGSQKPYVFDSANTGALMWEAGRATSAAPTYFKGFEFRGKILVDGGITDNAPGIVALQKAKQLHPKSNIYVISLGTGHFPRSGTVKTTGAFAGGIAQALGGTIEDLFAASENKADQHLKTLLQKKYIRITPTLSRKVDLADSKKSTLNMLVQSAEAMLNKKEFKRMITLLNNK